MTTHPLRSLRGARLVLALTAAIALLTQPAPGGAAVDGSIAGFVRDERGVPQMGALVMLFTSEGRVAKRTYTDERGAFSLSSLFPAEYDVKVTLDHFLPATKENVQVRSGVKTFLAVQLKGLFSSLHLSFPSSGRIRDMTDDWKWALRTSVNTRPALRILPAGEQETRQVMRQVSGAFSETQAYAEFSGGGARQSALANQTDLGTAFAVATSLFGNNDISLSGNLGYGARTGTPAAAFRTSFSRPVGTLLGRTEPEVSVTVRQLQASQAASQGLFGPQGAQRPSLRTFTLGFADQMHLTGRLRFDYGFTWESVAFVDQLDYVSPYGRLAYQLSEDREVELRYASGVPPERPGEGRLEEMRQEVSALGMFPRLSLKDGRPAVQRTEHYEIAYREHLGDNTLLEAAVYQDSLSDAAVSALTPAGLFSDGNVLPDLFGNSSTVNGGEHRVQGYRVSLARRIRDRLQAAVGYGAGGVVTPESGQLATRDAEELRDVLKVHAAHMVVASLSATLPGTETRVVSSYQWLSRPAAIAADIYNDFAARSDPGLNLVIRQPLPFSGPFPGKLEATADFRNLLRSGYVPVRTPDGGLIYLFPAVRSYRGALSFIF